MYACSIKDCVNAVKAKCPGNVTVLSLLESPNKAQPKEKASKKRKENATPVPDSDGMGARSLRIRRIPPATKTTANNNEHTQMQDCCEDANSEAKATQNNRKATWSLALDLKDGKLKQRLVEQRLEVFDFVRLPGKKLLEYNTGDYCNVSLKNRNMDVVVVAACRLNRCADKRKAPDYRVQLLLCVGNGKEYADENLVMITTGKSDVTIAKKGNLNLSEDKQHELLRNYVANKRPVLGVSWSEGLDWFYKKSERSVLRQVIGKPGTIKTSVKAKQSKKSKKKDQPAMAAASALGMSQSTLRETINSAISQASGAGIKQVTDKISQALAANKKQYSEMNRLIKQGSKASGSLDPALKKLGLASLKANETFLGQINAVPLKITESIDTAKSALAGTINSTTDAVKTHTSTAINTSTNELKTHTTTEIQLLRTDFQRIVDKAVEKALEIQLQDVVRNHQRELEIRTAYWESQRELTYLQGQMSMVNNDSIHPRSSAYEPTRGIANSQPGWALPKSISCSSSSSASPIAFSPALSSAQQNITLRPSNSPTIYNTNSNPYTAVDLDPIHQHELRNLTVHHHANSPANNNTL
jgi:hypothetical protein